MSIKIMTSIWKNSKSKGSVLLTMLAIGDFANDDGSAFPSVATLSRMARISHRQTQRAIKQLRRMEELRVLSGQGPHGTSLYRVTLCQGDKMSRVTSRAKKGDIRGDEGVTQMSPNPSKRTVIEPSETPHTPLEGERATEEWILDQWGRIPGVKQPDEVTPLLRQTIRARIREHKTRQWWSQKFFTHIAASDFLTAQTEEPFRTNLGWILSPKNMAKLLEGRFANRPKKLTPLMARLRELDEQDEVKAVKVVNP